jgi:hypothetical protein
MSLAWTFTQRRALKHLERYEDITKCIEQSLIDTGRLKDDYQLTLKKQFYGPRARNVLHACCWGALIVWVLTLGIFICCACCSS